MISSSHPCNEYFIWILLTTIWSERLDGLIVRTPCYLPATQSTLCMLWLKCWTLSTLFPEKIYQLNTPIFYKCFSAYFGFRFTETLLTTLTVSWAGKGLLQERASLSLLTGGFVVWVFSSFLFNTYMLGTRLLWTAKQGICIKATKESLEAHLHQAYKPCVIRTILSQTKHSHMIVIRLCQWNKLFKLEEDELHGLTHGGFWEGAGNSPRENYVLPSLR